MDSPCSDKPRLCSQIQGFDFQQGLVHHDEIIIMVNRNTCQARSCTGRWMCEIPFAGSGMERAEPGH